MKKAKLYSKPKNKKAKSFKNKERVERQSMYNTPEWKTYRFRFLHHNPKCYVCSAKSHVVDHIINVAVRPDLFENTTNHIPMCKQCHSFITQKFDKGKAQRLEEKMKYIDKMRKELGVEVKVKLIEYRKVKK
jgi:5-methylcytosine-specific restriction endonuclease McrA